MLPSGGRGRKWLQQGQGEWLPCGQKGGGVLKFPIRRAAIKALLRSFSNLSHKGSFRNTNENPGKSHEIQECNAKL